MIFKYEEDKEYFVELLGDFYNELFFDFRLPNIKRKEFKKNRNKFYENLKENFGEYCQLKYHNICDKTSGFAIDHLIPLSSNELNKKLRKIKSSDKKHKVVSESYGSNEICNLIIACNKCNNHKKHRIIDKKRLDRILKVRNKIPSKLSVGGSNPS